MVQDVLSIGISKTMEEDKISGIKMKMNCSSISYVFFANDNILFLKMNIKECFNVNDVSEAYCKVSGQRINFKKSYLCFFKACSLNIVSSICQALNVKK